MGASFRERGIGFQGLKARLQHMGGSHTKVGVQAGAKETDGSDMVIVAAANEFGTDRIPARSFMRSTFEEEKGKLVSIISAEATAIAEGRKTVEQSLNLIGLYYTGRIQAKIHSHPAPANAPSTIKAKGSSGTLVDSGALVQGIRHVVIMGGGK